MHQVRTLATLQHDFSRLLSIFSAVSVFDYFGVLSVVPVLAHSRLLNAYHLLTYFLQMAPFFGAIP